MRKHQPTIVALICALLFASGVVDAKKQKEGYSPLLSSQVGDLQVSVPLLFGMRAEGVESYALDNSGRSVSGDVGTDLHLRLGLNARWRPLHALILTGEYEQDVVSAALSGELDTEGVGMPYSRETQHSLRKASLRASLGRYVHLQGGFTTNSWGLGLVANDGTMGWAPGNALFADPRGGDRVVRLMAASGPHTPLNIFAAVAFDWVQDDDVLLDDKAKQVLAVVRVGMGQPFGGGVYFAHRFQDAADGDEIKANVIDFNAWARFDLDRNMRVDVEGELAVIFGSTTLGSSTTAPEHDIMQLAGAVRAGLHFRNAGFVLDFLYTSGDGNYDDDAQNNFKTDPNYQLSILMHRHVLAAQTGRGAVTAADPNLSGYPSEDLERLPTRGSITNTIAIFPRGYYRIAGFELYGGPLFAFAEVDNADPLNTKLNGGDPTNALGGDPGGYLGTEVDLGVRYRQLLWGSEVIVGVEGGVLFPGSAFRQVDGELMDAVWGGRALLQYRM